MDEHIYRNKLAKGSKIIVKKFQEISILMRKVLKAIKAKVEKMNANEIHPPENPINDYQLRWRMDA